MRSFPALMVLALVEYLIYALFIRPVVGEITEFIGAVAIMLHMMSIR